MPRKKQTSDFGKGFVYNLVLFAKHYEGLRGYAEAYQKSGLPIGRAYSLWFNGAGDHFYELEVPPMWRNKKIGKLALKLQQQALANRMANSLTKEEFAKFFDDLELLTRLIDTALGVKPIRANWS